MAYRDSMLICVSRRRRYYRGSRGRGPPRTREPRAQRPQPRMQGTEPRIQGIQSREQGTQPEAGGVA